MAPEQGLSSKVDCGKTSTTTNDSGESSRNLLHPNDALLTTTSLNWIYQLQKDQLALACERVNIPTIGQTVKELRKSLSDAVKQQRASKSTEDLFSSWKKEIDCDENATIRPPPTFNPPMTAQTPTHAITPDETVMANLVRHWNITYSGGEDLYAFLYRVETRAINLRIDVNQLLPALPALLTGAALRWHDVQGNELKSWEEFRTRIAKFFLPRRYLAQLEAAFYNRRQHTREKAREYILEMLTLIRQHPDLRQRDHLDKIYDGLHADYRLNISRDTVTSVDDLTTRTNEYEQLRQEESRASRQTSHSLVSDYDRRTHCWRCKTAGHRRFQCRKPRQLFCSYCGRNQIMTRDCDCNQAKPIPFHPIASRYFIKVNVKSDTFSALLDTGASQSCITEKMIPLLVRAGFKPKESVTRIQVANQQLVESKYAVTIPITLHGSTSFLRVIALPDLAEDLILGMDFLGQRKMIVSLDGKPLPPPEQNNNPPTLHHVHALTSGEQLSTEQATTIDKFLTEQKSIFAKIQGPSNITTHTIRLKHTQPIKQRYYPRNPAMQDVINQEIDSLLAAQHIEPSKSAYSSPIVLVRKKQGTWRMCIDYRQLNAASEPDAYPLPQIQAILDQLRDAVFISSIDLKNGYWQIPLDSQSRSYTAFTVPGRGLFQWKVMPFGLHSAPATFQRALDEIIGPDLHPKIFAYLDDIIITGKTFEEHMQNLQLVCKRLQDANMQINFDKSNFVRTQVHYLGHVVSSEGIHTDPSKVEAVQKLPPPTNLKELRRVLGIASWYRRFVPNFSSLVGPMTSLLKKNQKWLWGSEQQTAFQQIKEKLTTAPILCCPDFSQPFFLQTDASNQGLGVVLFQRHSDNERVVAYASRTLTDLERKYSTTEQECLAILWGIRKMRPYLEGYHFTVITDHHSLKWLHSLQNPSGRLARWALEIQQYDFDIEYRKGSSNVVADALSRSPLPAVLTTQVLSSDDWVAKKLDHIRKNPNKHPDYQIVEDRLFRHIPRKNPFSRNPEWKLCVAKSRQKDVLGEVHDAPTAGHLGVAKTLSRAREKYYWPGMYRDILRHVRTCVTCARYKPEQRKPAGLMTTMQCGKPWEIVCADFVGPLPRSSSGHSSLLVIMDKFTRWVELVPLRKATAGSVVSALKERVIYRFGCPEVFLSDNGKQFTSKEVTQFLQNHGIKHRLTAPYTPQENPTERTNRIVKTMIAQHCEGNHRRWDSILPEIAFAINTATREPTESSAAELNFGRNLAPPRHLCGEGQVPNENYPAMQLPKFWEKVKTSMQKASERQQHYYNLRRRMWQPSLGDQVLKREHPLSSAADHFAQKLAPKFSGPYIVSGFESTNIVKLHDNTNAKQYKCHVKDLKAFISQDDAKANSNDPTGKCEGLPRSTDDATATTAAAIHATTRSRHTTTPTGATRIGGR